MIYKATNPAVYTALVNLTALVLGASERTGIALPPEAVEGGLMTCQQYADRAGLKVRAVQRACAEGRIRAVRAGRTWLIPVSELAKRKAR